MTGKEPKHRDWIKLWIKEGLLGSIREDLTPEERATWWDFLLLAGNCRVPGTISANKVTPMPVKRIAGILNISEILVRRCIKKFEESGRIELDLNGVIHIKNWDKYQYSDYDRQKPFREKAKAEAQHQPLGDADQSAMRLSLEYKDLVKRLGHDPKSQEEFAEWESIKAKIKIEIQGGTGFGAEDV